MATEIQRNWLDRLTRNLKDTIAETTSIETAQKDDVQTALRKAMAKEVNNRRMRNATYSYMKVV